jgi:hypothetical protein
MAAPTRLLQLSAAKKQKAPGEVLTGAKQPLGVTLPRELLGQNVRAQIEAASCRRSASCRRVSSGRWLRGWPEPSRAPKPSSPGVAKPEAILWAK